MKTFDISKNILLAFTILISIALKLSAQEDATSLIKSDNIFIEKDKKAENTSKRNLPSKKILCYERNKKGRLDYIHDAILVFLGYILTCLGSIRTDGKRKKTIKKELEVNKDYLTGKYENVFKELLENDLSEIKKYLSKLKSINNAINFDFNPDEFAQGPSVDALWSEIKKDDYKVALGKPASDSAIDALNNFLKSPDFYVVLHKKKPNISFSDHITELAKKTKDHREKNFLALKDDEQYYIKRLNRLLIEAAYPKESPNIKETRLTKDLKNDYFIHLSDTSWNQYKYVISNEEYIISKAYMLIGEINTLSNASIHTSKVETLPLLARAIIEAKDAIERAIKELNLLTRSCCVKLAILTINKCRRYFEGFKHEEHEGNQ